MSCFFFFPEVPRERARHEIIGASRSRHRFDQSKIDSYTLIATKEARTSYLFSFGLPHSVLSFSQLKEAFFRLLRAIGSNNNFEVTKKKSRDYYSMMVTTKAK